MHPNYDTDITHK